MTQAINIYWQKLTDLKNLILIKQQRVKEILQAKPT